MSAFGLQNQTIVATPAGFIRSTALNGNDGSGVVFTWQAGALASLLGSLTVGTPFSLDLSTFYTDPGTPDASFGFHRVSGDDPVTAGFAVAGTPGVLTNACVLPSAGVFQIVAVRAGVSALTPPISFAVKADTTVLDTVAPTIPTNITAVHGVAVGTILVGFDAPCDIAPPGGVPSGVAHVDILANNAVVAPSPILTPGSPLASPVLVNLGNITSPSAPAAAQAGKTWTITAAGTGIVATTSEQCALLDFGSPSGAQRFSAKIDPYASPAATSLVGLMVHETAVAGGKLLAVGLRPANGTVGVFVYVRTATPSNTVLIASVLIDTNGQPLSGPVELFIDRSADNKTWFVSYALNELGKTIIVGTTLPMNAVVHDGIFATSASAGTAITATVEEVAITNGTRFSATVSSAVALSLQLRAVDIAGNQSALSLALIGVPTPPITGGGVPTKAVLGNGFWFDNQYWPGNQQNDYNAHINSLLADPTVRYIQIALTAGALWDDALTGGVPTYANGFAIVDGILAKLKTQTGRKVCLVLKWWQTFFNTTSVTSLSDWPQWIVNKGNWIKAFVDLGNTPRTQLDWDNDAIWTAVTDMMKAYGDRYNSDDHFLMFGTMDESVAVDVTKSAGTVMNAAHYNAKYKQLHLDIKPHWPDTLVWVTFNFLPPGNGVIDVAAMCDMIKTYRQAYPGGFCYGGPDPSVFGIRTAGRWLTTFQNIMAGVVGTLGDIRGQIFTVNNIEEYLLGNTTTGTPPVPVKPPLTPAQLYTSAVDTMKCQVCLWNYENWEYYKAADVLAAIHARNGVTAPLPTEGVYVAP